MIAGIGIDIVEVADIARRLDNAPFLKLFGEGERAYAASHPARRAEILAARWAAKEAFAKALGTGLRAEWPLDQIEVRHDPAGRPFLELGPVFQQMLLPGARLHCTLSHTVSHACAFVIIET